jgi:glycosyltransferase involved in cell wall biosynthesis
VNPSAPRLLLLIPAYNEEHRLGPVLRRYVEHFRAAYPGEFRLVVVLNGCRDNTLGVVQAAAAGAPELGWLDYPGRIGKGGALIEGLRLAPQADYVGYVDADGATPPAAFLDLVRRLETDDADCAIASRWLPGAVLHQAQSVVRRLTSRAFHLCVEALFGMGIRDTQCGAKVLRRAAVEAVHADLRTADLAFDINLLYVLRRAAFRVVEVPTEWTDQLGSKIQLGRSSLTMLLSILRLRLVYSPFYAWLRPLRPLETWLYLKLGAPPSLPPVIPPGGEQAARRPAKSPPPPPAAAG